MSGLVLNTSIADFRKEDTRDLCWLKFRERRIQAARKVLATPNCIIVIRFITLAGHRRRWVCVNGNPLESDLNYGNGAGVM